MSQRLVIVKFSNGLAFPKHTLKAMLPDVETALFFAQLYRLSAEDLSELLIHLFQSPVVTALTAEGGLHSHELQDYLVDIGFQQDIANGDILFGEVKPQGEILPELWKAAEIEIASSIQQVADKLKDVMTRLPGKHGEMMFKSLAVMNSKRPTIGDHKAHIHHEPAPPNLVVFDVSGSMSEETVQTLVDSVVDMSWEADAHLAIVSNTCTHWAPGEYTVKAVLDAAEYGGTRYETLAPLFEDTNWGVVVTIADYDSSRDAMRIIKDCNGSIEMVLDVSLVNSPTFLCEVVGQLANEVKPLLMAATNRDLRY